jgi:hypothetical protein
MMDKSFQAARLASVPILPHTVEIRDDGDDLHVRYSRHPTYSEMLQVENVWQAYNGTAVYHYIEDLLCKETIWKSRQEDQPIANMRPKNLKPGEAWCCYCGHVDGIRKMLNLGGIGIHPACKEEWRAIGRAAGDGRK